MLRAASEIDLNLLARVAAPLAPQVPQPQGEPAVSPRAPKARP
jgi:hypothetical protein